MTFIHTTSVSYKTLVGTVGAASIAKTAFSSTSLDTTIAAGASNVHIVLAVDVSQVLSFVIFSSSIITIKTNSPSSPSQIFTIKANEPLTWNSSRTDANPLTVDITDLYVSNPNAKDARLQIGVLP